MKQQTFAKPMDEREKLRRFQELDDAFADALRELDDPDSQLDIPTGPPVRSLEAQEKDQEQAQKREQDQEQQKAHEAQQADAEARQLAFERQLNALMEEYAQSAESVSELLRTLPFFEELALKN